MYKQICYGIYCVNVNLNMSLSKKQVIVSSLKYFVLLLYTETTDTVIDRYVIDIIAKIISLSLYRHL